MTQRGGRATPAHYGSAAGELAVLVSGVGLALRSDLTALSITANDRSLDHLLTRVLGLSLAPGGAAHEGDAWWCRSPSYPKVVVIHPFAQTERLMAMLSQQLRRLTAGTITGLPESWCVLSVAGRRASDVLSALGVYGENGDPGDGPPFAEMLVGGCRTAWLLQSLTTALVIVDMASAPDVWRALEASGRPVGISRVGIESIERFLLMERATSRRYVL
jgi:hypothetical protein